MYIALMDFDWNTRPQSRRFPNLELMKLSTFHKQNKDIVKYMNDAREWEQFSKVYIRKDKVSDDYPSLLMAKSNCSYGGLGFTNGVYIPLPQEIENCMPDKTIYDTAKKPIKASALETFNKVIKNEPIRLQTLQNYDYLADKKVVIYDTNPLQYDNFEQVYDLSSQINFRYPIIFYDFDEAFEFCKRQKLNQSGVRTRFISKQLPFKQIFEKKDEKLKAPLTLVYKPYNGTLNRNTAVQAIIPQVKEFCRIVNEYTKLYELEFDTGNRMFDRTLPTLMGGYLPRTPEGKKEYEFLCTYYPKLILEIKMHTGGLKRYE